MIEQLRHNQFFKVKSIFDKKIEYFPIIISVIEKQQRGYILKKDETYIIIHKFGFAYILGKDIDYVKFLNEVSIKLNEYVPIIRLYDPMNRLNNINKFNKNERVKYIFPLDNIDLDKVHLYSVANFNHCDYFDLELESRFWDNCIDFRTKSLGVVDSFFNGICYAAAITDLYAEVDIFVNDNARRKGIAEKLVKKFISECINNKIKPVWDCYTNNLPSVRLADKIGFNKLFVYNYYNIKGEE
jgi:GNAT superfamily N-acetyltransferase